jgi:catalase
VNKSIHRRARQFIGGWELASVQIKKMSDLLSRRVRGAAFLLALSTAAGSSAHEAARAGPQASASVVAAQTVDAFDNLFRGPHQGARAVHAKGLLVEGTFVPTEAAALLSRAVHFKGSAVPVVVRFSNFAGLPSVADNDAMSNPRGMSIKFLLPDGGDTDIVAHSYNGFPVATPEDFVKFLRALGSPDPAEIQRFLHTHPAAQAFAAAPNLAPQSYARESYFGVNAFRFTSEAGVSHYGRYRIEPVAGTAYYTAAQAAGNPPDYLAQEFQHRLKLEPARFRLMVQIARPGDSTTDGTVIWPDDRVMVHAGTFTLNRIAPDGAARQRSMLFTPLSLVGGISPSADPMLVARNRAYRVSYARRHAPGAEGGAK